MILVLEGVDGSGKSEVGRILAESLSATYYPTPPASLMARRAMVDAFASAEDHYRFYLQGVVEASEEIRKLAVRGNVVVDRYWITTVVYHRVMGVRANLEDFGEIVLPDYTAYLTVDPEIQMQRLMKRGLSVGDRRVLHQQEELRATYDAVLANQGNLIRIDTTPISQAVVAHRILMRV